DVADAGDVHAMVAISGDQVACPGGGAADGVAVAIPHSAAVVMVSYCGGDGGIGADVVARHLVIVAAAVDVNAAGAIAGDEVACSRGGAADGVAVATQDNAGAVGQCCVAAESNADGVAQHSISTAEEEQPGAVIAGDEVACPGGGAADRVAVSVQLNADAVGQGLGTRDVGPDEAAQHLIAAATDQYTVVAIAGAQVACSGGGATDRVIAAQDYADLVGQGGGAGDIGADGVPQPFSATDHLHAGAAIAGDKVACPGGGAADRVIAAGQNRNASVAV